MPAPGGLSTLERAVERGDAVGEAAQAGAAGGVGAAAAVVAHLDERGCRRRCVTLDLDLRVASA